MPTRRQEQRALKIALATLDAIGNAWGAAPGPMLQQYARQQKARAVAALNQDTHMTTPEPKPDDPGDPPEPADDEPEGDKPQPQQQSA